MLVKCQDICARWGFDGCWIGWARRRVGKPKTEPNLTLQLQNPKQVHALPTKNALHTGTSPWVWLGLLGLGRVLAKLWARNPTRSIQTRPKPNPTLGWVGLGWVGLGKTQPNNKHSPTSAESGDRAALVPTAAAFAPEEVVRSFFCSGGGVSGTLLRLLLLLALVLLVQLSTLAPVDFPTLRIPQTCPILRDSRPTKSSFSVQGKGPHARHLRLSTPTTRQPMAVAPRPGWS
jgi:hypothetical protein